MDGKSHKKKTNTEAVKCQIPAFFKTSLGINGIKAVDRHDFDIKQRLSYLLVTFSYQRENGTGRRCWRIRAPIYSPEELTVLRKAIVDYYTAAKEDYMFIEIYYDDT